jgi:hypothetical protein
VNESGPQPDEDHQPGWLDQTVADEVATFSQRISRRGLIAKAGKVALGLLGLKIAPEVLPVTIGVAEARESLFVDCGRWYLCNLWAYACDCPGCGGDTFKCPSCARVGGSWNYCCQGSPNCGNGRQLMWYYDCYKDNCSWAQVESCQACREPCFNGPERDTLYGGTNPYYMCTKVVFGSCSPCAT